MTDIATHAARSGGDHASTHDELLVDLLEADLAFETRSRNHLSSHLSMELVALRALGADDAELVRRADGYADRYSVPRADPAALDARREEVWSLGIAEAVRSRAGALVDSPATEWLHAQIRLAYAVEAGHSGQVANALLSWEGARRPFRTAAPNGGDRSMADVLGDVARNPSPSGSTSWDLVEADAGEPSRAVVDRVRLDDATWDDLASAALQVFVAQEDFGSLHMVTGTHAARVLAPLLDPHDAAVWRARTAQVLAAAHVAIGAPELPSPHDTARRRAQHLPAWDTIHAAAVRIPDAHVAKLVYTATREHEATGDPLYQFVAARAARLLPADPE